MALQEVTDRQLSFKGFKEQLEENLNWSPEMEGDVKCPICAYGRWTLIGGHVESPFIPSFEAEQSPGSGVVASIPVLCANCGFIAHFALRQYT